MDKLIKVAHKFKKKIRRKKDEPKYHGKSGAGLLFVCLEDKTVMLAKRADEDVREPGTWGLSGGKSNKEDSSPMETAVRESFEELTTIPEVDKVLKKTIFRDGPFKYTTYFCLITKAEKTNWKPKLNWEHSQTNWFPISKLPDDLHFGIAHIKDNIESLLS